MDQTSVCITRVGRIIRLQDKRALVEFFDYDVTMDVDVSMVEAAKDAYVEVFGDCAIARLSKRDAEARKRTWSELRELSGGGEKRGGTLGKTVARKARANTELSWRIAER